MSEPDPGVPALLNFGHVPLDRGWGIQPARVRHAALPLTWHVTEVLDSWAHPSRFDTYGQATVQEWWQLKVSGPLPGRPGETGEFVLEVASYGNRPGWWITLDQPPRG